MPLDVLPLGARALGPGPSGCSHIDGHGHSCPGTQADSCACFWNIQLFSALEENVALAVAGLQTWEGGIRTPTPWRTQIHSLCPLLTSMTGASLWAPTDCTDPKANSIQATAWASRLHGLDLEAAT